MTRVSTGKQVPRNAGPGVPAGAVAGARIDAFLSLNGNECKILGLVLLLVGVLRVNLINVPYERDEGAYIYSGKMVNEGQLPYRDFYEDKPPGNIYFYALMVRAFGPSLGNMHGGFMLLNMVTLVVLYLAARKLFGPLSAILSSLSFATLSLSPPMSGFTCMSEHAVMFFLSLGILAMFFSRGGPGFYGALAAGAALSMAVWIKQNAVFFLLWGGLFSLLSGRGRRLRAGAGFLTGAVVVSAAFLWKMWSLGVFGQFWFSAVELPGVFVKNTPDLSQVKQHLSIVLLSIWEHSRVSVVLTALGLIALPFSDLSRRDKVSLPALFCVSLLSVVPGLTFYGHYWLLTVPAAALLIGNAIYCLIKYFPVRHAGRALYLEVAVILLVLGFKTAQIISNQFYYFGNDTTGILRAVYGYNPFPSAKLVGDYLRERLLPGEKIAVFGSEPEVLLYANARSATRHLFVSHMSDPNNPAAEEWQKEFISEVEKAEPRYVIVVNSAASWQCHKNSCDRIFSWVNSYTGRHYRTVAFLDIVRGEAAPRFVRDLPLLYYKPIGEASMVVMQRQPPRFISYH